MTLAGSSTTAPPSDAFRFGKNWQRYLAKSFDSDRARIAAGSLVELVGDLNGRSFLDIGSGSGMFSLAAHRAGAREVVSFDVDPESVAATRSLQRASGSPSNWRVLQRSVLDQALAREIAPADVVYSWGVLHHTGDMWRAIANAARLVSPGGLLAIAIYNRVTSGLLTSKRWWQIKRAYNHAPRPAQIAMEISYGAYWALSCLRSGTNPARIARDYRESRGMALATDLVDWLGGYPYEFATPGEIAEFCEGQCGLVCEKVIAIGRDQTGNNQFVFKRPPPTS